ncbi:MAG: hypothetical protein FWE96_00745 [Coriobacteriia bacterium]|nr:hypothetical protein [Coriobacteriia bacterium]
MANRYNIKRWLVKRDNFGPPDWIGIGTALLMAVSTAVSGVLAAASGLFDNNISVSIISSLVCIAFIVIVMIVFERPPEQIDGSETVTFQPFQPSDPQRYWPRDDSVSIIIDQITKKELYPTTTQGGVCPEKKDSSNLVFVSGDSGSGKSVLMKLIKVQLAEANLNAEIFDSYSLQTMDSIREWFDDKKKSDEDVIILDQFEKLFAEERFVDRQSLAEYFRDSECKVVIAIRSEWVSNLSFLDDLAPRLNEILFLGLINAESVQNNNKMYKAIRNAFIKVVGNDTVASDIIESILSEGSITPLELKIIGAAIELEIKRTKSQGETIDSEWYKKTFGQRDGAIQSYFDGLLKASPNQRVTLEALCALSVEKRFRQPVSLDRIKDALLEDSADIQSCLQYLEDRGIVILENQEYQLAHDYLAEYFDWLSASKGDYRSRENIIFIINNTKADAVNDDYRRTAINIKKIRNKQSKSMPIRVMCGALIVAMFIRLIVELPFWEQYACLGHVDPLFTLNGLGIFDRNYFPIFLAHLIWVYYVMYFYERILLYVDPVKIGGQIKIRQVSLQIFSVAVVVIMCGCVIAAMFYPSVWVASIGLGGFLVGLRAWVITLAYRQDLNDAGRKRVSRYGVLTMVLSAMILIVGIISIVAVVQYEITRMEMEWLFASWVLCVVLFVTGWILRGEHVSPGAASSFLGSLARPKHPFLPSMKN